MGFTNKQDGGGSGKYANFKDGKIVTKIDGEKRTFTTIDGDIVDVTISSEKYLDKEYEKITVWIAHEDGCTQLGFPLTSGYGRAFCKILPNIDATQPVEISGGSKKLDNGNSYGTVFIRQRGTAVKWFFTANNEMGKKLPKIKEVLDGRGKVIGKDTSELDEFLQGVIVKFLKKVQKRFPNGAADFKKTFADADQITEPIDDLPF